MNVGPPGGEGQQKKPYTQPEFAISKASQDRFPDEPSSPGIWERLRRGVVRALERILFEPQSRTQKEQLARKILEYTRMNRRGPEPALINISEMAVRFRESRRNVRKAMELLEEQGTVERTHSHPHSHSKDHWMLTSPVHSPIRAPYTPPRVSTPSARTLLNPPPGWIELQNRAHKAKDAQEFNEIVDEMNRLLSAHENANGRDPDELPARDPE
jgi:DNA-binding transcriptional MocR family regulator